MSTSPTIIFSLSASHTLQKPQTKDNGFGSYFFFRKKEDFKFNFQSWSTFKKVQKIWIIELLSIDYHEKEKKIESNLYKKKYVQNYCYCFLLFKFFLLKHVIVFILKSMTRLNTPLSVWQPLHPDWRGSSLFIPDHRPLWSLAISRYTKPQIMSLGHVMWNYISN